ncbi:MAG: hypothetical protein WD872_18580 [Pirellulaceae bacterium]
MTDERSQVRSISWRDLFPWLILLRTFRIAIQPQLLALATAAALLMPVGWSLSGWMFLPKEKIGDRWVVQYPSEQAPSLANQIPLAVREYLPAAASGLLEPYVRLADGVRPLFSLQTTVRETAYYVFGSLWSLAIWALVGGFITRHAVVQLATEQAPGFRPTLTFAGRRFAWYFLTPLYPLLGIVLIGIPIAILGLLLRIDLGFGSVVAGLLWVFVVIASLAAVWLLGGLIFGWPLMWPAISAERDGDPFEAFSRSFSYVYGKPLHYLFYVLVAALYGALCLSVVLGIVALVTEFGFWALAWGAGGSNASMLRELVERRLAGFDLPPDTGRSLAFGSSLMALVVGLIRAVGLGYTFSFFWTVASAIYLLLRQDVDEKQLDEVFVDEPRPSDRSEPVVTAPVASAPVVGDPAPTEPEDAAKREISPK